MVVQPYLFFKGRCDEALAFYSAALDAQVTFLMRYREAPDPAVVPADWQDKVMHCNFSVGQSQLMASDGRGDASEADRVQGCALSLTLDSEAQAQRYFNALAEGGTVTMPFQATFWSPGFGMVTDRFNVPWMVMVAGPAPTASAG